MKNNEIIINGNKFMVTDEVYNKLVKTMRAKANRSGIEQVREPKATVKAKAKTTKTTKQTTKAKPKAEKSKEWTPEQYEEYRQLAKDYGVWSVRRNQPWKYCKPVIAKLVNGEITKAQFKKELNAVVTEHYSDAK